MSQKNKAIIEADRRGYHCDEQGNIYNPLWKKIAAYDYSRGYLAFSIRHEGEVVKIPVHRFVAFQKIGEVALFDHVQVRHLDGNKKNNSWPNLDIGTQRENSLDIPYHIRVQRATHAANCRHAAA